jgi:ribonuclease VapC
VAVVHDASSLLALAFQEPGANVVRNALQGGFVSSVNWSEFVQKVQQRGGNITPLSSIIEKLGVTIVPFTKSTAELAASLYPQTKSLGLSLGDRACLALGLEKNCEIYTTDKTWTSLKLSIKVTAIR